MSLTSSLRAWAKALKTDVASLWVAARDKRTPLAAKIVAGFVVAYALSPIDLIPDFIPILGYLDDVIILPLGIALAIALIPTPLMSEFREAAESGVKPPSSRTAAAIIVGLWLAALAAVVVVAWIALT